MISKTIAVGDRLVRQFGKGKDLITVVTKSVNGKTSTKVVDIDGRTISSRVKLVKDEFVGSKRVLSKSFLTPSGYGRTIDRVYDKFGELLGFRKTLVAMDGSKRVTKVAENSCNPDYARVFDSKGRALRHLGRERVWCNDLGLPVPSGLTEDGAKGLSLQDMIRKVLETAGGKEPETYFPIGSGLEHIGITPKYDPIQLAKSIDLNL